MTASLVLTVIGPDKPGLVERLSETVTSHGGNWLESRMSHLGGQFAGILRVSVPEARADELAAALDRLATQGLRTVVASAASDPPLADAAVALELVGHDRVGIVRDVSRVLAARGVNVEDFASERTSAAMSGEWLFKASARLRLPAGLDLEDLRADLERIAQDLMVDLRED